MHDGVRVLEKRAVVIQLFSSDHVSWIRPPTIEDGFLQLGGTIKNARHRRNDHPLVALEYHSPPGKLSKGQLARTGCVTADQLVAVILPPPPPTGTPDQANPSRIPPSTTPGRPPAGTRTRSPLTWRRRRHGGKPSSSTTKRTSSTRPTGDGTTRDGNHRTQPDHRLARPALHGHSRPAATDRRHRPRHIHRRHLRLTKGRRRRRSRGPIPAPRARSAAAPAPLSNDGFHFQNETVIEGATTH